MNCRQWFFLAFESARVAFELPVGAVWPLNCHVLCSVRPSPSVVVFFLALLVCKFKSHFRVRCNCLQGKGGGGGTHTNRLTPANRAKVAWERPGTVVGLWPQLGGGPRQSCLTTVPGLSWQACNEAGGGRGAKVLSPSGRALDGKVWLAPFPPNPEDWHSGVPGRAPRIGRDLRYWHSGDPGRAPRIVRDLR